ncbi:MAG: hypothetical protein KC613_17930 [Myxococcales bacterium]|nr:hypothetical protein [Myxococcales bacterium]
MLSLLAVALLAPSPPPLVVLRPDGVHVIDVHGRVIRTLSATPGDWAHRLPDGTLVVAQGAAGLLALPPQGKARPLGALPAVKGCGFAADAKGDHGLSLQSARDAQHSPDGRWLCVALQDRNDNMAEIRALYDVELATGKVHPSLAMAPGCPGGAMLSDRCTLVGPPAVTPPATPPPKVSWPFEWQGERGVLRGGDGPALDFCVGRPQEACDPPDTAAVSPSGRWRLLRLPTSQGDYMHHALFAVDHQTAALYPITEGAWPSPLTPTQRQQLLRDYAAVPSLDVVTETHIAATGHGERFAVDELLVSPGERVRRVGRLVP